VSGALGENWAGNYSYGASVLHEPRSIGELQDLVHALPKVRALGTRHSFNDIADSDGELVSTASLAGGIEVDSSAATVTVGGGVRYGVLAAHLNARGFALHNMGSLPHISVAGAISTGTHGSGNTNGGLATAVSAIELVTGGGELLQLRRGDPDFAGAVVALGALGIVTRLTLDVEPAFDVQQERYTAVPWSAVLDDFEAVTGAAYSVSLFTDWLGDELQLVWLKWRIDNGEPSSVPESMWGGAREVISAASIDNMTVRGGIPGPWSERLPHFRLDAVPSDGDEIQTEFFIDRADSVAALRAIRELGEQIAPHLLITELRTVASDELWMSEAFGRESLGIHFTWMNHPDDVARLVPRIEEALAPYSPRPHWGKWFAMAAPTTTESYPRFAEFRALADRLDAGAQFRNAFTSRVLGF
jgi:xylitol oxidase